MAHGAQDMLCLQRGYDLAWRDSRLAPAGHVAKKQKTGGFWSDLQRMMVSSSDWAAVVTSMLARHGFRMKEEHLQVIKPSIPSYQDCLTRPHIEHRHTQRFQCPSSQNQTCWESQDVLVCLHKQPGSTLFGRLFSQQQCTTSEIASQMLEQKVQTAFTRARILSAATCVCLKSLPGQGKTRQ